MFSCPGIASTESISSWLFAVSDNTIGVLRTVGELADVADDRAKSNEAITAAAIAFQRIEFKNNVLVISCVAGEIPWGLARTVP